MPLPASTITPSAFPLRFTEVVNFREDFGPGQPVGPKGIAFHPSLNKLIVSLSPNDVTLATPPRTKDQAQDLNMVSPDGTRRPFAADFHMHRDVESLIAIVPLTGVPVTMGHFIPGDVFVGRGPGGQITRLSAGGIVYPNAATKSNVFVDVGSPLWGGLTFDTVGDFGGELIVLTFSGSVFRVNSNGTSVKIATLPPVGIEYEGIAVAPKRFGPYGGWIIVGVEGAADNNPEAGKVYAINQAGEYHLLAQIPHSTEEIQFVPPDGGTYYQTEFSPIRERENRLWKVSASQFLNRLGRMLVVNELGNELWEVAWNGTQYTQSLVGRVPGAWTCEGYKTQGTELEAGCFASLPPSLPKWTDWSPLPGGATTDRAPAVAVDHSGNLHLLIKGVNQRRVHMNNMWGTTQAWTGWAEVPGGITTNHALATTLHNQVLYAFAVRDDGAILQKRLYDGNQDLLASSWMEVPGAFRTDTNVAAIVANGRLILAAKGSDNRLISLNELAPGGRHWSGWKSVPNSPQTDVAPALVAFQDELYVCIKDLSSHLLTKVRSADDDWTEWAEIPGPATSDAPIAAATAIGQLYLFMKGIGDHAPYLNVVSTTGTWSRWQALPTGGTTDTALAATAIKERIYLFAKGIDNKQISMRYTN